MLSWVVDEAYVYASYLSEHMIRFQQNDIKTLSCKYRSCIRSSGTATNYQHLRLQRDLIRVGFWWRHPRNALIPVNTSVLGERMTESHCLVMLRSLLCCAGAQHSTRAQHSTKFEYMRVVFQANRLFG